MQPPFARIPVVRDFELLQIAAGWLQTVCHIMTHFIIVADNPVETWLTGSARSICQVG